MKKIAQGKIKRVYNLLEDEQPYVGLPIGIALLTTMIVSLVIGILIGYIM